MGKTLATVMSNEVTIPEEAGWTEELQQQHSNLAELIMTPWDQQIQSSVYTTSKVQ